MQVQLRLDKSDEEANDEQEENQEAFRRQQREWDQQKNDEEELRKKHIQLIDMQIKLAETSAAGMEKKAKEKKYAKMGKHLQLSKADSKNLGKVAAHLKLLNEENEENRLSFLKEGAGALTLPGGYEKMAWI